MRCRAVRRPAPCSDASGIMRRILRPAHRPGKCLFWRMNGVPRGGEESSATGAREDEDRVQANRHRSRRFGFDEPPGRQGRQGSAKGGPGSHCFALRATQGQAEQGRCSHGALSPCQALDSSASGSQEHQERTRRTARTGRTRSRIKVGIGRRRSTRSVRSTTSAQAPSKSKSTSPSQGHRQKTGRVRPGRSFRNHPRADGRLPAHPSRLQYFTPHPYGFDVVTVTAFPAVSSPSAVSTKFFAPARVLASVEGRSSMPPA